MTIYKVSPPRENLIFDPSAFWRTADFKSSSTRHQLRHPEVSHNAFGGVPE
jgi:hypothetical protein